MSYELCQLTLTVSKPLIAPFPSTPTAVLTVRRSVYTCIATGLWTSRELWALSSALCRDCRCTLVRGGQMKLTSVKIPLLHEHEILHAPRAVFHVVYRNCGHLPKSESDACSQLSYLCRVSLWMWDPEPPPDMAELAPCPSIVGSVRCSPSVL